MQGLDILTLIIMVILIVMVGFIVVKLGALPGSIAQQRNHPQAEAIRVCGWIGILTLGLAWPIALIWAFTRPQSLSGKVLDADPNELARLKQQICELEKKIDTLMEVKGGTDL